MQILYKPLRILLFSGVFGFITYNYGSTYISDFTSEYTRLKNQKDKENARLEDINDCVNSILDKSFFHDYKQRKVDSGDYFQLNIDDLLQKLKQKRSLCMKGIYGTGTTEHALTIAEKWISENNMIIYFRPHSRLQVNSRIEELLKTLNTKEEDSFLQALIKLKKMGKEIMLIVDDIDCMDLQDRDSYKFINYLKNLQEDNLLHTMYLFRTNLVEKFITGIYNNDIPLVFIGENKFLDLQTQEEKKFIQKNCNVKIDEAEKFLFFFGMNYKIMNEFNDFLMYNKQNNKISKHLDDFIDAKVTKIVDNIELKGQKYDVLRLCKSIDYDGILDSNWKNSLASTQRQSLENNDFLVISGTTTALNRAALAKLCEREWRHWDLNKWKGKWNIEYYL